AVGAAVDVDVEALVARMSRPVENAFGGAEFLDGPPLLLLGEVPPHGAFGGQRDAVAAVGDRLADHLFAVSEAVDGGGVDERPAGVEKGVDRADRLLIVGAAPGPAANSPGAETDDRGLDAGLS